jgi:membrane protease subunit HflK
MSDQTFREGGGARLLQSMMKGPRTTGLLALVVLGVVLATSSVYTVGAEEVGVVLTFGKYSRQAEPGLRVKWPWPVQNVMKVPVQRQLKAEFGFRTTSAGVQTQYSPSGFNDESLMLTGDLNVAVVEWTTQFRVSDPYKYLFKVRNLFDPEGVRRADTFRAMNEAVMRAVIGDRSVNEVLTIGRQEIASDVERRLQELCDQYETGIKVEQVVLQDVNPPDQVRPAFNEVNQAQQEKERMINEARSEYNAVIPRARGEAQQTITQAEGYATDRINRSRGDAALFTSLLAAYRRAPDVTRRRLYLETMEAVYPNVRQKIILDEALKGILPLLPLSPQPTGGVVKP